MSKKQKHKNSVIQNKLWYNVSQQHLYPMEDCILKKLMNKIDRFCYLHPNFGIPRLMMYIVLGNIAVWLFSVMDTTHMFLNMLTFSPEMIFRHGQIWRLITFIFIPESSGIWLVFWLYFYYFIGNALEDQWGSAKFTIFYASGILFTVVYGILLWLFTGVSYSMTMHYVNLSMFFAFATLYPDMQVLLFFIIPLKIKWLAIFDAVLFAWGVLSGPFPLNLLPIVALLNYIVFFGEWLFSYFGADRRQQRKNTVNFKNEARRIHQEMKDKPYNRKCEVCGRTDKDYPDLEFRYCSRCAGYHCYCIDHINNHVHKQE